MKSNDLKKKSNLLIPSSSDEAYLCIKNGIKVYPIFKNGRWFIQVDNNGKLTTIDKSIQQNEINVSMAKTYIHYAKKLTNLKKD